VASEITSTKEQYVFRKFNTFPPGQKIFYAPEYEENRLYESSKL